MGGRYSRVTHIPLRMSGRTIYVGMGIGVSAALWKTYGDVLLDRVTLSFDRRLTELKAARSPNRIIIMRHAESMANLDLRIYETTPDNQIEISENGFSQAAAAGERLKAILGNETVRVYVSPYQRTYQTCRAVLSALDEKQVSLQDQ